MAACSLTPYRAVFFSRVTPNGKQRSRRSYRILHHYCCVDYSDCCNWAPSLRNEDETQHSGALRLSVSARTIVWEGSSPNDLSLLCVECNVTPCPATLARSLVNNHVYASSLQPQSLKSPTVVGVISIFSYHT